MLITSQAIYKQARAINVVRWLTDTDLFGKDGDILIERIWGAHVAACHSGLPWRACGQLAFLEHKREQWK